ERREREGTELVAGLDVLQRGAVQVEAQLDAVRGAAREPGEFVGDLHCVVVGGLGESRVAAKAQVRDALRGGGHLDVSGGEDDVGGGVAGAGRVVGRGLVVEVPAEV